MKEHSHYHKDVRHLDTVDVYAVCELFGVNDPSGARQHAIKKLLCAGSRGVKSERQDLKEAADTINRRIEMLDADLQLVSVTTEPDATRFNKLRRWMASNTAEGWAEVTRLGAIACYLDFDEFNAYLDGMPDCNLGLCEVASQIDDDSPRHPLDL